MLPSNDNLLVSGDGVVREKCPSAMKWVREILGLCFTKSTT